MSTPLVTIRCLVYNHEPYLRQCLDGFVMQKTNFPFEAIVHDDASTDRSAEIIREYAEKYPDIIKPIFETENQYSKKDGSLRRIMDKHMRGKYIAMCEGDDYWIDPLKLQKQVDFLELNSEYGLVYTPVDCVKGNNIVGSFGKQISGFEDLLVEGNVIPTLTTCFRREFLESYNLFVTNSHQKWRMGDFPLWLWISLTHKLCFIPEKTGAYRIIENSVSHPKFLLSKISFIVNVQDIKLFFGERFGFKQIDLILQEKYWWLVIQTLLLKGEKKLLFLYLHELKKYKKRLSLKQLFIINSAYISTSFTSFILKFYLERILKIAQR